MWYAVEGIEVKSLFIWIENVWHELRYWKKNRKIKNLGLYGWKINFRQWFINQLTLNDQLNQLFIEWKQCFERFNLRFLKTIA
jgi:hypothetical protein